MAVVTASPPLSDSDEPTRLQLASDDLMSAIDAMVKLIGGGWEHTVDELVNVSFDPTQEPPARTAIDPERLAAARERLSATGQRWAEAIVEATAVPAPRPVPRARLDAALERIGHQSSPVFRDRLAGALEVTR